MDLIEYLTMLHCSLSLQSPQSQSFHEATLSDIPKPDKCILFPLNIWMGFMSMGSVVSKKSCDCKIREHNTGLSSIMAMGPFTGRGREEAQELIPGGGPKSS